METIYNSLSPYLEKVYRLVLLFVIYLLGLFVLMVRGGVSSSELSSLSCVLAVCLVDLAYPSSEVGRNRWKWALFPLSPLPVLCVLSSWIIPSWRESLPMCLVIYASLLSLIPSVRSIYHMAFDWDYPSRVRQGTVRLDLEGALFVVSTILALGLVGLLAGRWRGLSSMVVAWASVLVELYMIRSLSLRYLAEEREVKEDIMPVLIGDKGLLVRVRPVPGLETVGSEKSKAMFRKVDKIMEKAPYADKNFGTVDLVRKVGTNPTSLAQTLRECCDMSTGQYIASCRLQDAMDLWLEEPRLGPTEVAYVSGFGSLDSMSRTWRKFTGMSHTQWHGILQDLLERRKGVGPA